MNPTPDELGKEIIRQAGLFLHLKEVNPNTKWDDPRTPAPEKALNELLVATMKEAGWPPGAPYCAAFAEGMVVLAMRRLGVETRIINRFRALMTPHCMTSYRNFRDLDKIATAPVPGAIFLMKSGATDSGHAGIVVGRTSAGKMKTREGNTSAGETGDERERQGDGIHERDRNISVNGNLKTQGFITPEMILSL